MASYQIDLSQDQIKFIDKQLDRALELAIEYGKGDHEIENFGVLLDILKEDLTPVESPWRPIEDLETPKIARLVFIKAVLPSAFHEDDIFYDKAVISKNKDGLNIECTISLKGCSVYCMEIPE